MSRWFARVSSLPQAGFVTATFIDREPASSTWTARLHGRVDLAMLVLKLALTAVYNLSPADLVGDPVVTVALILAVSSCHIAALVKDNA